MTRAPRTVWTWTAPPPDGRQVEVWVDDEGQPLDVDVDVSDLLPLPPELSFDFRPIQLSRVTTPRLNERRLAALLAQCR